VSVSDNLSGPQEPDWMPECPECRSADIDADTFALSGRCNDCGFAEVDMRPPEPDPD